MTRRLACLTMTRSTDPRHHIAHQHGRAVAEQAIDHHLPVELRRLAEAGGHIGDHLLLDPPDPEQIVDESKVEYHSSISRTPLYASEPCAVSLLPNLKFPVAVAYYRNVTG